MKHDYKDLISAAPIGYVLHNIVDQDPWGVLGIVLTEVITKVLKKILPDTWSWTRRPAEATCDLLSQVKYPKDSPGFPSGHVAATTFFFMWVALHRNGAPGAWAFTAGEWLMVLGAFLIMVHVRMAKGCHTLLQCAAGAAVGAGVAVGLKAAVNSTS